MTRDRLSPAPEVPFRRPRPVVELSRTAPTPFRVTATAAEREALARHLGVARVDHLSFEGTIAPAEAAAFVVDGRLVARLEQTCVVTLEPLAVHHDLRIARRYLPAARLASAREVTVPVGNVAEAPHGAGPDPEAAIDDDADPYEDHIDPAAFATESLLLLLDPYPRAPGAELGELTAAPPGAVWEDEAAHPFARLAELRRRMDDDEA